jgi:type 1 glutamine amidotransferase
MAWTREEGSGRVAYVGLGHTPAVWAHPTYRQVLRQAAAWLTDA